MNDHVNGWGLIENWLKARHCRQIDLARVLAITPSAVTQIKKGEIVLHSEQIETIFDYLGVGDEERCKFYTQIFNVRMSSGATEQGKRKRFIVNVQEQVPRPLVESLWRAVPLLDQTELQCYRPGQERLADYASRCAERHLLFAPNVRGDGAFQVNPDRQLLDVSGKAGLLLDSSREPQSGEIIVGCQVGGSIIIKRYWQAADTVELTPIWGPGHRRHQEAVGQKPELAWFHPVCEMRLMVLNA